MPSFLSATDPISSYPLLNEPFDPIVKVFVESSAAIRKKVLGFFPPLVWTFSIIPNRATSILNTSNSLRNLGYSLPREPSWEYRILQLRGTPSEPATRPSLFPMYLAGSDHFLKAVPTPQQIGESILSGNIRNFFLDSARTAIEDGPHYGRFSLSAMYPLTSKRPPIALLQDVRITPCNIQEMTELWQTEAMQLLTGPRWIMYYNGWTSLIDLGAAKRREFYTFLYTSGLFDKFMDIGISPGHLVDFKGESDDLTMKIRRQFSLVPFYLAGCPPTCYNITPIISLANSGEVPTDAIPLVSRVIPPERVIYPI